MLLFPYKYFSSPLKAFSRLILTDAYACTEKWNSRFSSNTFGNLSASDLGTQIQYRLNNRASITPLDYDIFVNKVQQSSKSFLDFLETTTYKFRETQNSLKTLPSTHHAFVRDYIHHNEIERVLDILKNRAQTGIFLDEVSANLLQESFIKKEDFSSALSVMWELCLQSHLEQEQLRPYLTALWLHTANELIRSDVLFERSEVVEEVEEEIDMDTDFQSVPYLRNPNYDGWFDIRRPRLQLGHCLFSLSSAIENDLSPIFSPSMAINLKDLVPRLRLLAYALVEDSKNLLAFANSLLKSNVFDTEVLSVAEKLIESSDRRTDDSEIRKGVPILLTESEVASTLEQFKVMTSGLTPSRKSFHTTIDEIVKSITTDASIQAAEIELVESLYSDFESTRAAVWKNEAELHRRREVISTVKSRLRSLADEEERISYFENVDTIEHRAWLAPRTRSERQWSRLKEWKKDLREYQQRHEGGRDTAESL
ncbi:unnamed protein product [Hymenolepis diminuta]|uniref:Uncharacterized protein n=1 Tax=Hymenolepis diminuta TaxID=6216 RepID=A0A564YJE4_HYMDI|nr:unnamed protein product [Hymenolepis diminuta]